MLIGSVCPLGDMSRLGYPCPIGTVTHPEAEGERFCARKRHASSSPHLALLPLEIGHSIF